MAVKARDIVKKEEYSVRQLALVLLLVVAFNVGYKYLYDFVDDSIKIWFAGISMIVSILVLYFILLKLVARYEYLVVDKYFVINRAILFRAKAILMVPLSNIDKIYEDSEVQNLNGRKHKFTLAGIKNKKKYIISYKAKGKNHLAYIQINEKFIDKLNKTIIKRKNEQI